MAIKKKIINLLKNLILLIIVLGLSFLILEGIFRIIKPEGTVDRRRIIATADERGLTIHKQNIDDYLPSPETQELVHMKTNQEGFIGNDYSLDKPTRTIRIAIFGDSFTEAIQVDFEKTFGYLLEKQLNQQEDSLNYEVMNFAVGGSGTMEALLLYYYYAKKYQPDLVILFFFENDFENNQFYLSQREKISSQDESWIEIEQSNANFRQERQDWRAQLLKFSRFIQWADRVVRTNPSLFNLTTKIGLHHQGPLGEGKENIPTGQFIFQLPLQEIYQEVFVLTKDLIKLFKSEVANNGSKFSFVYLPEAVQADEAVWQKALDQNQNLEKYTWDFQQPNKYLEKAALENKIPFFDLTPEFISYYQASSDNDFLYIHRTGHLNELGHQLVADKIQEFIKEVLTD